MRRIVPDVGVQMDITSSKSAAEDSQRQAAVFILVVNTNTLASQRIY